MLAVVVLPVAQVLAAVYHFAVGKIPIRKKDGSPSHHRVEAALLLRAGLPVVVAEQSDALDDPVMAKSLPGDHPARLAVARSDAQELEALLRVQWGGSEKVERCLPNILEALRQGQSDEWEVVEQCLPKIREAVAESRSDV